MRILPKHRRVRVALLLAAALVGVAAWRLLSPGEPVSGGRTLTEWLYNTDPDFVWIPNDVYGHIHDELRERLESGEPWGPGQARPVIGLPEAGPRHAALQALGTNALPWLLDWMSSRPRPLERVREFVQNKFALPLFHPGGLGAVERRHVAAFDGFSDLGRLAEPALPALSKLLNGPDPDLPLAWAIARIGPGGIAVLTNALTSPRQDVRDLAALSLGLEGPAAAPAVPVLLAVIDRGDADYDVLGALGRIGCEPERAAPVLLRQLDRIAAGEADDPFGMTILLLGLCGEAARPAVPALLKFYETADPSERAMLRAVLDHIDPAATSRLGGGVSPKH